MPEQGDLERKLQIARSANARQAEEINRLRQELQRGSGADALDQILQLGAIVGATIGKAPYLELLQGIVVAAQYLFHAQAASIMLLDHKSGDLVIEASTDRETRGILGMRFPANQGIAGWVMMTGEPIVVGDVRHDPRFAVGVAQATGYVPESILAAPLLVRDETEGVLEVLDKRDNGTFGLEDMDMLSLFARPAAVAVEQARLVTGVGQFLIEELARLTGNGGNPSLHEMAQTVSQQVQPVADDTLELARLVHEVARRGESERRLALELLTGIARYIAPPHES